MRYGLFNTSPREIRRDDGERVSIWGVPFTRFYITPTMEELSRRYDIALHIGTVPSSLGDSGMEWLVKDLFKTYQFVGGLCGLREKELRIFAKQAGHPYRLAPLLAKRKKGEELFSTDGIEGVRVVFPTENLLINQKVPLRQKECYAVIKTRGD